MMAEIKTQVQGVKELQKQLRKLGGRDLSDTEMKSAMLAAAKPIKERAKSLVPVKTGLLKRSIDVRERMGDVEIGAFAPHAWLVEFGHSGGAQGNPYMRPAYYEIRHEAIRIVRDHMAAAVAREAR
jgi:HK97 gp10 family phage protein